MGLSSKEWTLEMWTSNLMMMIFSKICFLIEFI